MKRAFDVLVAGLSLVVLAPVLAIIALGVMLAIGRPVLFRQKRGGLNGTEFELVKFRSMFDARDASGELLPDEERLPAFGRLLRSTSLDELPELWNVLRGDMSLVGPRPLLADYLPLYSARQARRHEVRPGITGWSQVNGRNAVDWDARLEHDVWYVDNRSFLIDLRILLATVGQVLRRDGVEADGGTIMPRFEGSGGGDSPGRRMHIEGRVNE